MLSLSYVIQNFQGGIGITLKGETYRASSRKEYCKIRQDIIREKEVSSDFVASLFSVFQEMIFFTLS